MSTPSDFLKLLSELNVGGNGGTQSKSAIDLKMLTIKKNVLRMMKEGKQLKDVMGLLDKAVEGIDEEMSQVLAMSNIAQMAAQVQLGTVKVDATNNVYNVKENRMEKSAKGKADETKTDEGTNPAANPSEQPNLASASSSSGEMNSAPEDPAKVPERDTSRETGAVSNRD